jgi:hypothetical protein
MAPVLHGFINSCITKNKTRKTGSVQAKSITYENLSEKRVQLA